MAKGFGVSPITNTIYYGEQKKLSDAVGMFTGKKEDVTDAVIKVVFDWFMNHMSAGIEAHIVTFPNVDFELVMRRKEDAKED